MKANNTHADDLIETLVEGIEAQSAPWQTPWKCDGRLPTNLVTGKTYSGRNLLMLATTTAVKGYADHRWAGFQQIKASGGHVRRGERGHWICIMRTAGGARARTRDARELDVSIDAEAPEQGEDQHRQYIYTAFRPVWNASQCEGIVPIEEAPAPVDVERGQLAAGEAYLAGTPVSVNIARRDDACYRTLADEVLLPRADQFEDPVAFYQTALHELAHATGHRTRLDRRLNENRFGSARYIREELVAEMAAFLASTNADLGHSPGLLLLGIRKPDGSGRCQPGAPWRQDGTLGRGTGIRRSTTRSSRGRTGRWPTTCETPTEPNGGAESPGGSTTRTSRGRSDAYIYSGPVGRRATPTHDSQRSSR